MKDTFIEFRRDIKALTLPADTTSSGSIFHSSTTRTEKNTLTRTAVNTGAVPVQYSTRIHTGVKKRHPSTWAVVTISSDRHSC